MYTCFNNKSYKSIFIPNYSAGRCFVIIKSTSQVTEDYNMPDGTKGGTKGETHESMAGLTFVKKNSVWKITSEQITSADANAAPLNPVK